MNCYGLPEDERDYYRLAHRHRTVLNRVPYNQNGRMQDGCAPVWDSRRMTLDWSSWDRRFGPLLDGSAFADLPRKSVPVECLLPAAARELAEPDGRELQRRLLGRSCLSRIRIARRSSRPRGQIAAHFQAKHWNETLFQGFLNNKNNFKANGWSRGSSPWLLDEPASFQDYWALRYFARAFHEGINQAIDENAGGRPPRRRGWSFAPTSPGRNGGGTASTACSTITWSAARCEAIRGWSSSASEPLARSCWNTARPTRSRARTSSRSRGAWMPGRWGPTASSPGRRSGTADSWKRADELALFYPHPAQDRAGWDGDRQIAPCRFRRSGSRRIAEASRTSST